MSRSRRRPIVVDVALLRVAEQLGAIADRLAPDPPAEQILEVLRLPARHLGLAHLGRWIMIPGRPDPKSRAAAEPAIAAQAGKLVGLRTGNFEPGGDQAGRRVLVLQQGNQVAGIPVRVDELVEVAPREWS